MVVDYLLTLAAVVPAVVYVYRKLAMYLAACNGGFFDLLLLMALDKHKFVRVNSDGTVMPLWDSLYRSKWASNIPCSEFIEHIDALSSLTRVDRGALLNSHFRVAYNGKGKATVAVVYNGKTIRRIWIPKRVVQRFLGGMIHVQIGDYLEENYISV